MSFDTIQDALIHNPSQDAMRLIGWRHNANTMFDESEPDSNMRRFISDSISLVIALVQECEAMRQFDKHDLKASDLLLNGGVFQAIEDQILQDL